MLFSFENPRKLICNLVEYCGWKLRREIVHCCLHFTTMISLSSLRRRFRFVVEANIDNLRLLSLCFSSFRFNFLNLINKQGIARLNIIHPPRSLQDMDVFHFTSQVHPQSRRFSALKENYHYFSIFPRSHFKKS